MFSSISTWWNSESDIKYLRVHISQTGDAGKFGFKQGNGTFKKIIIYTHPDLRKKTETLITEEEYDKIGQIYEYDGNMTEMIGIFSNFEPAQRQIKSLISELELDCNLKVYKNLWNKLCEWAQKALQLVGGVMATIVAPTAQLLTGLSFASQTIFAPSQNQLQY